MRQFKLTAITLGLLSATALPALAGPMGHAHFGGGEAAEAIATSTSAPATAVKTLGELNHGSTLKNQMGQVNAKNAVSAVQNKAQVAKPAAKGTATETIAAAKTKLESSKNASQSLADANPAKVKQTVEDRAKSTAQTKVESQALSLANANPAKVKQDVAASAKSAAQTKVETSEATAAALQQKAMGAATRAKGAATGLQSQETLVKSLKDINTPSVGTVVNAQTEEAATKAKALQTQTGIAVDSLSIANSSKADNTQLFR